jgi:hypothetical protein
MRPFQSAVPLVHAEVAARKSKELIGARLWSPLQSAVCSENAYCLNSCCGWERIGHGESELAIDHANH